MSTPVTNPFEFFTDANGNPLDSGSIYIGEVNLNPIVNPIAVYWDVDLTIPALLPIRTSNGYPVRNGTPSNFYVPGEYSILVQDKNGKLVFSNLGNQFFLNDPSGQAVHRVDTISDLRALSTPTSDGYLVQVNGYYAIADGGGGPIRSFVSGSLPGTYVDNGGSIIVPTGGDGSAAWVCSTFTAKSFGAVGNGTTDDTTTIQNLLTYAGTLVSSGVSRIEVVLEKGRYKVTGLTLPSRVNLSGPGELAPFGIGVKALKLENTKYSSVRDVSFYLSEASQIGISLEGTGGDYAQLNNFYNLRFEGNIAAGTVCVKIDNSFSNSFFGCIILRSAYGIIMQNAANANHFFGGELRSVNTNPECKNPITHASGCLSNGFHGVVIENWALPISVNGGNMTIDGGCYIEAFASSMSIEFTAGSLKVSNNYLNNGFIFIYGGESIIITDNIFDGTLSNSSYPFVKYLADVVTYMKCDGNRVLDTTTPGVLLQPRQYWTGAVFAYRSVNARNEDVKNKIVRFQSRLVSDANDVTGDGTSYQIVWGGNEQFDDGSNVGATFVCPENGIYFLETKVYFNGLSAANTGLTVNIVTSNRTYQVYQTSGAIYNVSTRMSVGGSALVDMEAGDTAYVTVVVSGATKTVDIFRGDATNGYTTFSGFKV